MFADVETPPAARRRPVRPRRRVPQTLMTSRWLWVWA